MELIAKLIRLALIECHARGLITWTPDQGAPESFIAECEIEMARYWVGDGYGPDYAQDAGYWSGDYYISLLGLLCVVGANPLDDAVWHSEIIERPHSDACLCDECARDRFTYCGYED